MAANYRYANLQDQSRSVKHTRLENESEFEKQYTFGCQLGKGSFGTVMEAIRSVDEEKLAVKIINKEKAGSAAVKLLEREVSIMKKVKHENIIFLEEVFETSAKMFLVMELCNQEGLEELLEKKSVLSEQESLCIFQQLADAVSYIHQNDIIHRDLKLDNILLAEPVNDSKYNIKLTDFGLSYTRGGSGSDYMMNQVVGTPIYMAPEVITNYGYSQQCDIWSIGVILYKILSGDAPFLAATEEDLFELIKKGELKFPATKWSHISQSAKQLIECTMKVDPAHRLTSKEILHHPWIKGEPNGTVTTNVLEMMKQYSLEQKQLAEKQKNDEVKEILSNTSINSSTSNEGVNADSTDAEDCLKRASIYSVTKDNDNNNNDGTTSTRTDKKSACKSASLPSYMQPTKSSKAPKNPNSKASVRRKKETNS